MCEPVIQPPLLSTQKSIKSPITHNPHRKWIIYFFALTTVSLSSGICYGWPALRRNLILYPSSISSDIYIPLSEKSLGGVFTVGAVTTQGGRIFFGLARDRFGTKYVTMLSLVCVIVGALGIALSRSNDGISLAISAGFAGFGSGAQLCLQPVAQLFPEHSGVVLSSLSGAFMLSGSVFLILASITTNRKTAFLCYTGFIFILFLMALIMLPLKQSFLIDTKSDQEEGIIQDEEAQNNDETKSIERQEKKIEQEESTSTTVNATSSPSPTSSTDDVASPTAMSQICSLEYVLLLLWFSACIVPMQYYVASIGFQLERKGDINGAYTNFQQIMSASTAITSPIVGVVADKFGSGFSQGFANTLSACAFFILSTNIPLRTQTVGIICYSFARLCTFAYFFCNIGKRFGYANYGTLTGIGFIVTGVVSLLQYPLIALTDDGHEEAVNLACGSIFVVTLPYCVWLWKREQQHIKAW